METKAKRTELISQATGTYHMQANNSKPFQHMFKCLKDALCDPGESLLTLKVNSITSLSSIYPSNLSAGDLTQVT